MKKTSVSFIVPDMAGPVLGPVTSLATALGSHYKVQIIGPDLGRGVCPMYEGLFDFRVIPTPRLYRLPDYLCEIVESVL